MLPRASAAATPVEYEGDIRDAADNPQNRDK